MNAMQRKHKKLMAIYQQYVVHHSPLYALRIACGIVYDRLPF